MLNCHEVTEHASDYLDRCLPWGLRVKVWLHVLICRNCQRFLRQMRTLIGTLGKLPELVVAEDAVERQVAMLKQSEQEPRA